MLTDRGRRTRGPARHDPEREFAKARVAAVRRLVRDGMPLVRASAWIQAWDESTRELVDFRRSGDFWLQGYRYAREEQRRGYEPPLLLPSESAPLSRGRAAGHDGLNAR